MDDSFNQYKEKLGASIATRLNDAYSQGAISSEESPIIAKFILDKIDTVTNHTELMSFLEELANKWSIFGPLLIMEKTIAKEDNNNEIINQAEQLIKENKIDEALNVVEDANNPTEGGNN